MSMLEDASRVAKRESVLTGEGDAARELVVAWRTSRGTRLVIAFPGPERFILEPGARLDGLDEGELAVHLEAATGLTGTEATFVAPDGRRWLAQAAGPVWAASEGAEGLVATRFTSLEGPYESFESPGSPLRPDRPEDADIAAELSQLWILMRDDDGETPS
ncbi:MAG: hypothetical protein M8865_10665 [marine benthic group bacterium]|nr:hypothetical protein [Gemmatimonadota bacterium]